MFLLYCAWLEHLSIVTYTYIVCKSKLLPIMMHPVKIQCLKKKTHNSYIHVVLIVTHCWNRCFLNYAKYGISILILISFHLKTFHLLLIYGIFLFPLNARFFLWATFLYSLRLHILIFDKTIKSWNINFFIKTITVHKIHRSIINQ